MSSVDFSADTSAAVAAASALTAAPELPLLNCPDTLCKVFDQAALGYVLLDADGFIQALNDSLTTWLGQPRVELLGRHVGEVAMPRGGGVVVPSSRPPEAPDLTTDLLTWLGLNADATSELSLRHADGSQREVLLRVRVEQEGRPQLHCILTDISQHKQAEAQMRLAARLFDRTGESVVITDADHVILTVNAAFERVTGYAAHEVLGRRTALLGSGQHDRVFYEEMLHALQTRGWWQGEIWNRRRDGQLHLEWLSIHAVTHERGHVEHYIGVYSDPGRFEASQRRIEYLATHDELTGLPNRFLFNDRVRQAIGRASDSGEQVAVMFVDLDEFKLINDTLGHAVGDELLRGVAQRLRESVRACDTVARLGGDEFAVMIERTSNAEAEAMARRVVALLGTPLLVSGRVLYVGASLGIGLYPGDGADSATLLQVADVAMYAAKAKGKRTHHFYTSELKQAMDQRLQLEMGLRWAIERDELRLLYQPQVHVASGSVIGVEPLVRWQRPGAGWLMPASFIPMAEKNGLIDSIGLWVAREACRQVVAWQAEGYCVPRVSINVSAAQFRHPGLVGLMSGLLAEYGLPPAQFVIELTESALMDDPDSALQQLRQFQQAGFRVSIDDFGTGQSSLSSLRHYPLDELKIDRSFITEVEHSPRDVAVLRAILTLSEALELDVVVEGVETQGQLMRLRELGCQVAQGFWFSRPVSAEAAKHWLPRGNVLNTASPGADDTESVPVSQLIPAAARRAASAG